MAEFATTEQNVLEHNLFEYCENEPICFFDPSGNYKMFVNTSKLKNIRYGIKSKQMSCLCGTLKYKIYLYLLRGNYKDRNYIRLNSVVYKLIDINSGFYINNISYSYGCVHTGHLRSQNVMGNTKKFFLEKKAPKNWKAVIDISYESIKVQVGASVIIDFSRPGYKGKYSLWFIYNTSYWEWYLYKCKNKKQHFLEGRQVEYAYSI